MYVNRKLDKNSEDNLIRLIASIPNIEEDQIRSAIRTEYQESLRRKYPGDPEKAEGKLLTYGTVFRYSTELRAKAEAYRNQLEGIEVVNMNTVTLPHTAPISVPAALPTALHHPSPVSVSVSASSAPTAAARPLPTPVPVPLSTPVPVPFCFPFPVPAQAAAPVNAVNAAPPPLPESSTTVPAPQSTSQVNVVSAEINIDFPDGV